MTESLLVYSIAKMDCCELYGTNKQHFMKRIFKNVLILQHIFLNLVFFQQILEYRVQIGIEKVQTSKDAISSSGEKL